MFWGQYGVPPRGWRGDAAHGGGKFFDLGAQRFADQALQLVDAPVERVYAAFHTPPGWSRDIEAHAMASIRFANGVEARREFLHGKKSETALVCSGHRRSACKRGN